MCGNLHEILDIVMYDTSCRLKIDVAYNALDRSPDERCYRSSVALLAIGHMQQVERTEAQANDGEGLTTEFRYHTRKTNCCPNKTP